MQLLMNNASSKLAAALPTGQKTLQLQPGEGGMFPNPKNGDYFLLTLFQRVGATEQNWEIVLCTARDGDVLTIVRAQEGTTEFPFNPGDYAEMRLTAGMVIPARAGVLTGALNEAGAVPMACNSAMAIGAAGSNTIQVVGTGAIKTFDNFTSGARREMILPAGVTLINSAVLRCLSGKNIVTEAGDRCVWQSAGAGAWDMSSFTRASGNPLINPAPSPGRLFFMKG